MRYAVRLAYKGKPFSGWQSQKNAITVQETIENAMSKRYGRDISIVGCCRTDKGVHASDYVFHFDTLKDIDDNFIFSINNMLPREIALKKIAKVSGEFHSRFDAIERSYIYKINSKKNPFEFDYSFYYPLIRRANFDKMQEIAQTIAGYNEFFPFCKAHTDVKTMKCDIKKIYWKQNDKGDFEFHITADRFLRGMVRLIVGMSINLGLDKIDRKDVLLALDKQERMKTDWSVPAHGLYLNNVKYLTLD